MVQGSAAASRTVFHGRTCTVSKRGLHLQQLQRVDAVRQGGRLHLCYRRRRRRREAARERDRRRGARARHDTKFSASQGWYAVKNGEDPVNRR